MKRAMVIGAAGATLIGLAVAPGTAGAATTPPASLVAWTQTLTSSGGSTSLVGRSTNDVPALVQDGAVHAHFFTGLLHLWPAAGSRFSVGSDSAAWATSFKPSAFPADHVSVVLDQSYGYGGCLTVDPTAAVDVQQADYDASGTLVGFAAHVRTTCSETGSVSDVDIRIGSELPVTRIGWFAEVANLSLTGGTQNPYLTNLGTTNVALDAVSITGATAGWSAVADLGTCGAVLPAHSQCRPHVVVTGSGSPGGVALHVATPDGPADGTTIWLHTAPEIPKPVVTTRAAVDGVHVEWDRAATAYPASAWDVYRSDSEAGPFTLAASTTLQRWGDTSVAPGATAYYRVAARRGSAPILGQTLSSVVSGSRLASGTTGDGTSIAIASTPSLSFAWAPARLTSALASEPEGAGTYSVPSQVDIGTIENPSYGSCLRPTGALVVRALRRLAAGDATVLDATFTGTCHGGDDVVAEFRVGTAGSAFSRTIVYTGNAGAPTSTWVGRPLVTSDVVQNLGDTAATLGVPTLLGAAHPDDWALTTSCTTSLAPQASCTVTTTWTPSSAGPATATVHLPGVGLLGTVDRPRALTAMSDTTPPTMGAIAPLPAFVDDRHPTVETPTFADTGSGPFSIDARAKLASAAATSLTDWLYPRAWQRIQLTGSSGTLTVLAPGRLICTSFRARDLVGNTTDWVPGGCTSLVWDDSQLLQGAGRWSSNGASLRDYHAATWSLSTVRGSSLLGPSVRAKRVAVLVTTCATCGSLDVYVGSTLMGTVSTRTNRIHHRVMVQLPIRATAAVGRLRLVVRSSGLPVIVDGVGTRIA